MGKIVGLVVLALAAIGAMIGGGHNALHAFNNQTPTEISCAELVRKKPSQIHLTVTDCRLDVEGVTYFHSATDIDDIESVIVPLLAPGQSSSSVHLVLSTTDSTWIKHASVLANLWTLKEKAQFVTRNGLDEPLTFRGTVTVIDEDDVETLFLGLAEDYVLLEHNKKPNWMIGSAIFLGGLALLGFGFGSFFHSRRRRKRVEMATRV